MSAQPQPLDPTPGSTVEFPWDAIAAVAPQIVTTMASYLDQLAVSSRPGTVEAYELTLRQFAGQLVAHDPTCRSVAQIERRHIEHYKL